MGVYSSWPIFALTHHCIVRYAAWLEGEKVDGLYAMLGDDITIANKRIATRYKRLITYNLGIGISEPKSYIPDSKRGIQPAEFAKQLVSHGRVLTPLTPDLLEDASRHNWPNLASVFKHVFRVWNFKYGIAYTDLPRFVILAAKKNWRRTFRLLSWPTVNLIPKRYLQSPIDTERGP